MKISIYTFVKDGLFYDFHVAAMLRHHLPLADEIIVNEGFSTDGTFEAIRDIDPKVKIHRSRWDQSNPDTWHRDFKNHARQLCTGDWCILLDCDEFIPEWEFDRLRAYLASAETSIVPVKFVHFYGNYKVYLATLPQIIPLTGMRIHRNIPEIEVWGDGANVRFRDREYDAATVAQGAFEVHHFGTVRNPARLRQKWRTQARQHDAQEPALGQGAVGGLQHVSAPVERPRLPRQAGDLRPRPTSRRSATTRPSSPATISGCTST